MFGTLGSSALPILSNISFIPQDGFSNTISLTGENYDNKSWIGLSSKSMQFWAYAFCTPLAAVIDRLTEAEINGEIKFIDKYTKVPISEKSIGQKLRRIKRLFEKPNPWQTWTEFDAEQTVYCKIFGYCPVLAINPGFEDKSYTKAFVNICPLICEPVENTKFDIFDEVSIISSWTIRIQNKEYNIRSEDIILMKDGFIGKVNELGLPMSKISGMDFFISNICVAMEADNVLLRKKGPLGIFSYDPAKDIAGTVPLEPSDKDDLQNDLNRYGLTIGQVQYIISKMPVKWNPISFNARDLMTKETVRQAIDGICDRMGYPAELMSGKNATYENRNSSEKWLYNNNIIPVSSRKMKVYSQYFDIDGVSIIKDYDDIAVLQEDIVKAGEAAKNEAEGLKIEWEAGMITYNEWRIARGRDPVSGMDIYYNEYIDKFPSMNKNA